MPNWFGRDALSHIKSDHEKLNQDMGKLRAENSDLQLSDSAAASASSTQGGSRHETNGTCRSAQPDAGDAGRWDRQRAPPRRALARAIIRGRGRHGQPGGYLRVFALVRHADLGVAFSASAVVHFASGDATVTLESRADRRGGHGHHGVQSTIDAVMSWSPGDGRR